METNFEQTYACQRKLRDFQGQPPSAYGMPSPPIDIRTLVQQRIINPSFAECVTFAANLDNEEQVLAFSSSLRRLQSSHSPIVANSRQNGRAQQRWLRLLHANTDAINAMQPRGKDH